MSEKYKIWHASVEMHHKIGNCNNQSCFRLEDIQYFAISTFTEKRRLMPKATCEIPTAFSIKFSQAPCFR